MIVYLSINCDCVHIGASSVYPPAVNSNIFSVVVGHDHERRTHGLASTRRNVKRYVIWAAVRDEAGGKKSQAEGEEAEASVTSLAHSLGRMCRLHREVERDLHQLAKRLAR